MRRAAALALGGLALACGACGLWAWRAFEAPGPLAAPVSVIVPKGAGLDAISRILADAGVVGERRLFVAGVALSGLSGRLRAGEYAFPPGTSMAAAARRLASGDVVQRRLAVPEGLTSAEVVRLVAATEGLSGRADAGFADRPLLPETYFFSWGDARGSVLRRMADAMEKALRDEWRDRAAGLAIRTPREALVLASMIDKETGVAAERARISAVFQNRLRRRMRLQSDPTVVYALTGGKGSLGRPLRRSDLDVASPYNTYRRRGLPPGPIANPGRAAIRAAVRPLATDELYFVADGEGGHRFARTLREHNRNVRKLRRRRGGRP